VRPLSLSLSLSLSLTIAHLRLRETLYVPFMEHEARALEALEKEAQRESVGAKDNFTEGVREERERQRERECV